MHGRAGRPFPRLFASFSPVAADHRRRYPHKYLSRMEGSTLDRKRVIFIDVDDTLIRTVGTTQIPMPASVDYVRRMHAAGNTLYCWSRGGRDHARNVTKSLGIADCFVDFLPKPDICLDDRGDKLLDYCEVILPSNAVNH